MSLADLRSELSVRIGRDKVTRLSALCSGVSGSDLKEQLLSLISHPDDRIGFNALWVMTHFRATDRIWLYHRREELIRFALTTPHVGKRRLALTLIESMPLCKEDVRSDLLDFCLSRINSTEPYGIRALCLKLAFAHCRFYPELTGELKVQLDIMEATEMSAGVSAAQRQVKRGLAALESERK